ncbi:Cof-type HAD-IIB family hydrolase [Lentibacillus jeotgali]|uniref:Cof-type HAD-IIB family hydrolase n=1 Tax=Lentibacillus jeotgali TaxID=558169 RepID=UPI0002626C47|nr:Cof-type HAD-IIB family hydrolase [Lentibacillus jeotgali]
MKLIAIDLDGTLLSDDGNISQENKDAIYEAQKSGHIIVISSGRSLHDTRELLKQAEIDCPFITGNGGMTYYSGEVLQQFILPLKTLGKITRSIEKYNLHYEIYTNQGILISEKRTHILYDEIEQLNQQSEREHAAGMVSTQYSQHGIVYVPDFHTVDFAESNPYKVFVLSFKPDALEQLHRELSRMKDVSLTAGSREKLEIAHGNASKGNGLKSIAAYFKVPLEDTVAIGDNLNDISMFKTAATGIAMENAEQEVQKCANFITKHHNDSGVAYALREYVVNRE